MPFLEKAQAFEQFRKWGRNSSHFVWFLADLKFFRTSNDWIFGFAQRGDVTLLALEPLICHGDEAVLGFDQAWREFSEAVQPKISIFISIYSSFAEILSAKGFQNVK